MKMIETRWDVSHFVVQVTLARRFRRAHTGQAFSQELTEGATMLRVKQASKQKRTTRAAVKVLGAAGLGLSLVGSAAASTMPTAGVPQSDNTSADQRFVLGEEEMADVSLATFHLFDRENVGSVVQTAWGGCGGCGGCRGCGGFRGCAGCRGCGGGFVGCRGCGGCVSCAGCGGCASCAGCGGCASCAGCGGCASCAGCGGCAGSWGACRDCGC
jgi:hypothetical protein